MVVTFHHSLLGGPQKKKKERKRDKNFWLLEDISFCAVCKPSNRSFESIAAYNATDTIIKMASVYEHLRSKCSFSIRNPFDGIGYVSDFKLERAFWKLIFTNVAAESKRTNADNTECKIWDKSDMLGWLLRSNKVETPRNGKCNNSNISWRCACVAV